MTNVYNAKNNFEIKFASLDLMFIFAKQIKNLTMKTESKITKERLNELFGNRFGKSKEFIGEFQLGQWIDIDLTKRNCLLKGFAPKRNWNEIYEMAIVHISETSFIAMTGSHNLIQLPFTFLK